MSQAIEAPPKFQTVADLLHQLGDIPPERVRLRPMPGKATERDLLKPDAKLCELIDGTLVEKTLGAVESMLTVEFGLFLGPFIKRHRLGIVLAANGMVRLMPGKVRLPDTCFISWDRLPGRKSPTTPILDLAPNLAVEVLSKSNTKAEMIGPKPPWLACPGKSPSQSPGKAPSTRNPGAMPPSPARRRLRATDEFDAP